MNDTIPPRLLQASCFALALVSLGGCAASRVSRKEDNLAAAGFVVRPANTPARLEMLRRLPPHRFVRREQGDQVNYVYADPSVCGCLYVGDQTAYNQYKRDRMEQKIADQQALTAEAYRDSAWDWGSWGPWDARYGFTYQPGIVGW